MKGCQGSIVCYNTQEGNQGTHKTQKSKIISLLFRWQPRKAKIVKLRGCENFDLSSRSRHGNQVINERNQLSQNHEPNCYSVQTPSVSNTAYHSLFTRYRPDRQTVFAHIPRTEQDNGNTLTCEPFQKTTWRRCILCTSRNQSNHVNASSLTHAYLDILKGLDTSRI